MRPAAPLALASLIVLLSACAGPPAPAHVWAVEPRPDPYAVRSSEEFPPAAQRLAPRILRWTWDRHRQEVGALTDAVEVTVGLTDTTLAGPAPDVDVVARYLADRDRFADALVHLDVWQVLCAPDALKFGALTRGSGGLWCVAWSIERLLEAVPFTRLLRLTLKDGEPDEARLQEQRAFLASCGLRDTGVVSGPDPRIDVLTTGLRVAGRARLVGEEGDLLVLDWLQTTAWEGAPAALYVGDVSRCTGVAVELPRKHEERLSGRFVLRSGEALLFVQATTDAREDVLLTLVTWSTATR